MAATVDERVAFLEGRVVEHSQRVDSVVQAIGALEARMDRRFEALEQRITSLEQRMDQRFAWLVGIQVTTLVAVVAAVLAR